MKKIGGNTTAVFQVKTITDNVIGEGLSSWSDALTVKGWLDLSNGDSKHNIFNAKVQESTHIFLCDYQSLGDITEENARLVVNGKVYEILLIDNPMEMNEHLEIYLKYIGGQNVG